MRQGQNPLKSISSVDKPERITAAVLNYIPFISGYYAFLPEVLDTCLRSLVEGADLPFDLMVFDNGSCIDVQKKLLGYLHEGLIKYLILSDKNLGKGGAWNIIFGSAPGEIIAYADNDVLFYPGWLSASVKLLETYPNVGMVTSRPFRTSEENISASIEWAKSNPDVKLDVGQLLPYEWFYEFSKTLCYSDKKLEEIYNNSRDFRVSYNGVIAQLGGSHWQFLIEKKIITSMLPFTMDRPMGQVKQLDERINAAGYLRLMPVERYVQNMSNTPPREVTVFKEKRPHRRQTWKETPIIKSSLLWIYNRIFQLYYGKK